MSDAPPEANIPTDAQCVMALTGAGIAAADAWLKANAFDEPTPRQAQAIAILIGLEFAGLIKSGFDAVDDQQELAELVAAVGVKVAGDVMGPVPVDERH